MPVVRDNRSMRGSSRFGIVLAMGLALAVAAVAAAISMSVDNDGLDVAELTRVEAVPDGPESSIDGHLRWLFEVFAGDRPWTDDDLADRLMPGFAANFTAEELNEGMQALFDDLGTVRFVRVADRQAERVRAVAVAEDGTPMTVVVTIAADGRLGSLSLDVVAASPRLRSWEATLALLVTWLLLAAATISARSGAMPTAWAALAGSVLAAATVLILSDSAIAYTLGRTLPALVAPIGVWLLATTVNDRRQGLVVALAGVGGVVGALAPFVRDAALVGHPAIPWSVADDAGLYRGMLTSAEALVGGGMAVLVVSVAVSIRRVSRWRRPPLVVSAGLALLWAASAAGSAIDYSIGDGSLAGGALSVASWSALTAVPLLVTFQLVAPRWDRPELANLVIDLKTEGADLPKAVARALDDDSLQLLTSTDGRRLEDDRGRSFTDGKLPEGRALTEIRSGERLVGALVHKAALKRDPTRLQAVAAAAGMALEVGRLNRQVTAQLEEVNASRTRIVQANDEARRRIERDLHDGAQQRLVALALELQRARRRVRSGVPVEELGTELDAATAEVRAALAEIRAVSKGARPALLAERGLEAAVQALADRAPVPVRVELATKRLSTAAETTAYYVIAEGLTNVAKHAQASWAEVSLAADNGTAVVRINDDGAGGATVSAGSGLEGLGDRVAATGGTLDISSDPSGTTLTATIPCD